MIYEIYVEGELNETHTNKRAALKRVREARKEGWNVKLIEVHQTILGPIRKEVMQCVQ